MKYRKKAVVIDAEVWDGTPESWNAIQDMGCTPTQDETCSMYEMIIPTLEDGSKSQVKHIATLGDYIIKGVQGEFYPCKPDIFALTYEVADAEEKTVYVLTKLTGDYEDKTTDVVKVFLDKDQAEAYQSRIREVARNLYTYYQLRMETDTDGMTSEEEANFYTYIWNVLYGKREKWNASYYIEEVKLA